MVDFKLVISSKEGKSYQQEIKEPDAKRFVGMKIGDTLKGESINMTGYEFQITGGSDYAGFPMRKDVPGAGRKRVYAVAGTGIHGWHKGMRQRKIVCGNTIHNRIVQINLKVLKEGAKKVGKEEGKEAAEAEPAAGKAEPKASKSDAKGQEKKAEQKAGAPAEKKSAEKSGSKAK